MKLKIKGFEVEGSVEEIKELIKLEEGKTKKEKTFYISSSKGVLENENRYVTPKEKRVIRGKYKKSNPETDKRVIRMKFLSSRAKNLMYNDVGMSYEKALSIANDEYNYKFKKQVIQDILFPLFTTTKQNTILQGMVERVINIKGNMSFINDGYALGIDNVKEWHNFTSEFMQLSQTISDYFKVKNTFKYIQDSAKIIYE